MSGDQAHEVDLLSAQVARLLGVSQATVTRIPKDRLDYWTTPGGHRRYSRRDVEAYARNWLGRDLQA